MLTLVLGGMRSGKSEVAERLAERTGGQVTVIATGVRSEDDRDFAARIERHRARRPAAWRTIETTNELARALTECAGTVLVDTIGTYIGAAPDFRVDVDELCKALSSRRDDTIVVSDEVGLAVHPASEAGRRFADALGECNQAIARIADRVVLVVAGRTLELGPCDA